jgi:hypothetical protein
LKTPIFDPREEARALAFHMGRERGGGQRPSASIKDCATELRAAEVECLMQTTPHDAPIRRMA